MVDLNNMLTQLVSSSTAKGFAGGLAGGLASNMLSGKKAKKLSKNALKIGGAAAIGAIAFSAYKRYQTNPEASQANPQPGTLQNPANHSVTTGQTTGNEKLISNTDFIQPTNDTALLPDMDNSQADNDLPLVLIRAMIAASRADGSMDSTESHKIFESIQALDLDQDSKNVLLDEMNHPIDMDYLINQAQTQEKAAEIYAASLLAIDVDSHAEESYLQMLAARLKLPAELTAEITQQIKMQNPVQAT
ncbi:MAG: Unknown protein [uncultured Thiotrichaceae bacterium]|uniref:Tellurite resistance TerB family protein n=1 Tax=uncultured Thiotrichaceae bacterium TaxID=298394 RepID=A0A6S6U5Q9_9GAMM|nr:MAG: Unknown protein [uncultured Thiotrichaceae bacterium]